MAEDSTEVDGGVDSTAEEALPAEVTASQVEEETSTAAGHPTTTRQSNLLSNL